MPALGARRGPAGQRAAAALSFARDVAGPRPRQRLLRVDVADDGTLDVRGPTAPLHGVGRVVDGGDRGDSYNYASPPPTSSSTAGGGAVELVETGRRGIVDSSASTTGRAAR